VTGYRPQPGSEFDVLLDDIKNDRFSFLDLLRIERIISGATGLDANALPRRRIRTRDRRRCDASLLVVATARISRDQHSLTMQI
jgi:hypothetical protein